MGLGWILATHAERILINVSFVNVKQAHTHRFTTAFSPEPHLAESSPTCALVDPQSFTI